MPSPLTLPGCVPLHGKDFVDPVQNRQHPVYQAVLDVTANYPLARGIFVNTFVDLEPGAVHALQTGGLTGVYVPPVYPVGPVVQSGSWDGGLDCKTWLDEQPMGSVLYVSFGSGGTLSSEQLNELATGLEKSGVRFLWVVRTPNDDSSSGSFFTGQSKGDTFGFLPTGFVDRVKDRGLLVPSWAQQVKVLEHESTGGFLTHCGWNSILESVVNGVVPLIAWPLYAEQRMNAVLLNEGLKVALRPEVNEERGVVEGDEIVRVVRDLMEGGEAGKMARQRMKEYGELAKRATSQNGESTKSLGQVASMWTKFQSQ